MAITIDAVFRRFFQTVHPVVVILAAVLILTGGHQVRKWVKARALIARGEWLWLREHADRAAQTTAEVRSLHDLKARDLAQFKEGLSKLTESKRSIYEAGLLLQEERRLLEKQWEMMSTYLRVDADEGKIHVMRGDQALESYPYNNPLPQQFGLETRPLAKLSAIISKERFANPERGKSEEVNGQLQWEPPQVGTSIRANALGEFVMFTNGPLILHGDPIKPAEHGQFPHYCLGLTTRVAQKLYGSSFIGTKISVDYSNHKADE